MISISDANKNAPFLAHGYVINCHDNKNNGLVFWTILGYITRETYSNAALNIRQQS